MTAITQKLVLDDVVKFLLHPAYNLDVVASLNNGKTALAVGDQLLGKLAWNSAGTTWKILDEDDVISATSIICPIVHLPRMLEAELADAAGVAVDVSVLRRGPALIHYQGIDYGGAVEATVNAAMLALGIKVVNETGVAVNYDIIT